MPSFWEQFKTTITSPIKRIGEWFKPVTKEPGAPTMAELFVKELPGATKAVGKEIARGAIKGLTLGYIEPEALKPKTEAEFRAERLPIAEAAEYGGLLIPFGAAEKGFGLAIKGATKIPKIAKLTTKITPKVPSLVQQIGKAAIPFAAVSALEKPEEGVTRTGAAGEAAIIGTAFPIIGAAIKPVEKPVAKIMEKTFKSKIPPELEPLAQEARKYKSAKEFIKNLKEPRFLINEIENTMVRLGRRTSILSPNDSKLMLQALKERGFRPEEAAKIERKVLNNILKREFNTSLTDFYNQAVKEIKKPPTMAEIMPGVPKKPPKPPTPKIVSPAPEPPKGLREKGFLTTVKKAEKTTDELKQALGEVDLFYRPVTNKNAIRMADAIIKSDPDKARAIVLDPKVPVGARKSAMAIRLAKKYEAEKNWDAALEIIESYDDQLRAAGRFIQAASLWNKLSPESIVRLVERAGKKYKKEVPQNVKKIILRRMAEIQKMPEGPIRDRETLEVLNYVADQFPLTFREKFDAFRYQNILSNPRSHERNIFGNLLQTFITRPLDLIGEWSWDIIRHPFNPAARDIKLAGIPKYYQAVFKTIPDAFLAFKEGFRSGAISEKIFDVAPSRGMTMIEFLRRQKLPKWLTVITRFMEAQDRFFSVLIGAGEKARLMTKGVAEEAAEVEAKNLAEKYLYRETVGITTKDQALFVRALDGLGKLALEGRNIPVIGKVWSWFVPFVRTPINIAKFGVERSPLGFIGGTHTDEQMGKALIGSIITGIGATLALQDRTTFLPPTDPEAKRLFYDSGRKPLSIRIGDSWVPMWYFGPYAISLALPAAVKYYTTETKEALAESEIEKIVKIVLGTSRIITEQTPLSGMSNFMKAIEGDIDYSVPGTIARTVGQIIPFSALLGYINTVLDPVYRKSKTFSENLKKQLPGMTKDLPAYEKITGEPATRNWTDFFLPYSVGMSQDEFEKLYKEKIREMQMRYEEKELERRSGAGETIKILPLSEWGKLERKRAKITPLSEFGR